MAAIQLEPRIGDVAENLKRSRALADAAAAEGAEWILLPEFFTTGMGFVPELADAALRPDGEATDLLLDLARRHGATVGGSFLARDPDGEVRNAFLLATPDGIAGRHDKDLPTMWENAFYVGGSDDGLMQANGLDVGTAVCWEFMRTQTARRLRGRIDLLVGGSFWWSIPPWPPAAITRRREAANERQAVGAAPAMAPFVGAPVVHAANCGPLACALPWAPFEYRGHVEGGASITDAHGRVLAFRDRREGPGVAIADLEPGRVPPSREIPDRFWLHRRDPIAAFIWAYQRAHGRRWYARHVRGRPPLTLEREPELVA
ncbi:MAG: carbon-nitrogen hydrolase family protein [Actinomycetota bacterium]|nr:carbon-nitrogen hydrolase family protein [Actinomycetota bacterium]